MRKLCVVLTAVLLLCLTAGCGGSDKEKGQYRDRDKPRAAKNEG
jgi:uncharacterized lipoprotein